MMQLHINQKKYEVDVSPDMPLLWVLRDKLGLMGTKFGCGKELCGACTVLVNGQMQHACATPIASLQGAQVTTIEGLSDDGKSHPLQQAWIAEEVPQCGYCQSGQIMAAAALLNKKADPSDAEIDEFMSGILCRCGTYQRIRRAIHRAAQLMAQGEKK